MKQEEPIFPLYETIIRAAKAAAFQDSRFPKLQKEEYANIFIKEIGAKWFARCFSFSCPLASEADLEDLKEHNHWGYEEWKNEKYDPTEAGGDFMHVHDDKVLSCIPD